jgi:hypothetical protein
LIKKRSQKNFFPLQVEEEARKTSFISQVDKEEGKK